MAGFKDLTRQIGGWLMIRGVLRELQTTNALLTRIATALEAANAHQWPQTFPSADPTEAAVAVTHVNDADQQMWMDVELDLTAARGMPPTEEEVLAEFERRKSLPGHAG